MIGDGYVLVHYPTTLPTDRLDPLRTYVTSPEGGKVVAGAEPGQTAQLKTVSAYETMTCADFDLEALRNFTKVWIADPHSRTPE